MQANALHHRPPSEGQTALSEAADRIGASASFLCALHCAALPFVFALLPALGLGFLGDDEVRMFETGPWTRLTTLRGHVLVKRKAWTLAR